MKTPEEVSAVVRLHERGWGSRRIARELGMSRTTVKRYLAQGGWLSYRKPRRGKRLEGLEAWLEQAFRQHRGNAEVVRQELMRAHGVSVSLRTVERAVAPLRRALVAEARATVRFETSPGRQVQIDFGQTQVPIGGERVVVHLFVATLGYSRRNFVMAFEHERQSAWLTGLEAAFRHFGGVPEEVLVDNPRALVSRHDVATREVVFHPRFHAFCRYWGIRPRACAPYRARTKGKDENGVGYVKRNAIAGREFHSWAELEGHLAWWMREVADVRVHGTTGEPPIARFAAAEAAALRPLQGRAPFVQVREVTRRVQSDACVEVDTNRYSVPWRWIGEAMRVRVADGQVRVFYADQTIATHAEAQGRRQRCLDPAHLDGIVGAARARVVDAPARGGPPPTPALLRPLAEYEALLGGGW
jgi:transposase